VTHINQRSCDKRTRALLQYLLVYIASMFERLYFIIFKFCVPETCAVVYVHYNKENKPHARSEVFTAVKIRVQTWTLKHTSFLQKMILIFLNENLTYFQGSDMFEIPKPLTSNILMN
jgi:hypothetical protein